MSTINEPKMVHFKDAFTDLYNEVDFRIHLAHKNHGYSISAQIYDCCPHLRKLDILDFTLSLIQ